MFFFLVVEKYLPFSFPFKLATIPPLSRSARISSVKSSQKSYSLLLRCGIRSFRKNTSNWNALCVFKEAPNNFFIVHFAKKENQKYSFENLLNRARRSIGHSWH